MKRIFCIAFISIVCSFSFLTGFCSLYSVPVYGAQDQWETLTSNEQLVDAFKVYCKSRNMAIDGSVLDAVSSFTTKTFNNICNTVGIDMTLLQAEIQRMYSGAGYRYAFSASGLSGMNRIFAEFLQNNDLAVGDEVDHKVLKSGRWFQDDNGNGCWVYETAKTSLSFVSYGELTSFGSTYLFNGVDVYNLVNSYSTYTYTSVVDGQSIPLNMYKDTNNWPFYYVSGNTGNGFVYRVRKTDGAILYTGMVSVIYYSYADKLYFCAQRNMYNSLDNYVIYKIAEITGGSDSAPQADIYITTNNTTINNETVINEGDTIIYNNDGTPDSGGGSGDDSDWNPVLPDVPGAGSDPSGGNTIDWPDLDLPDFDLPNFSLGDLRLKFPFSIPFDIVSILGVINAPAVAPVIQEDIPIRIDLMNVDYTIPINLDMSDSLYDNFAVLVRAVEFIGFCIGLIHLTIRLVKG